jgi:hypothetical protein
MVLARLTVSRERISLDKWSLGFEDSSVVGLRILKIAAGGTAAETETRLMFREKIQAGWTVQGKLLTGALGPRCRGRWRTTLAHYRRKVRSNQRRLAK